MERSLRRLGEAEQQLLAALELRQRTAGDDAIESADTPFRLAWNEYAKEKYAASIQLASRALAAYRQHADHVGTLQALWMKQLAFNNPLELSSAEQAAQDTLSLAQRVGLEDNPMLPKIRHVLSTTKLHQGDCIAASDAAAMAFYTRTIVFPVR